MKLHHYSLIFVIIALSFLVGLNVKTRIYRFAHKEREYLDQTLAKSIDDSMVHFPEEVNFNLHVNKERVVDNFLDSMYSSLGICDPKLKEELEFHIPLMSITSIDGFYVYFTSEYKSNNEQTFYKKQWSEKHPFYYEDDNFIYRFTLSDVITIYDKNLILDKDKEQSIFTLHVKDFIFLERFSEFRISHPDSFLINEEDFYRIRDNVIISTIDSVLNEYCNKHNEIAKKLGISYVFHVPQANSEWMNVVDGPSFLVLLQGYPLRADKDIVFNQFIISSSKTTKRQLYVIEEKDEELLYHKITCEELLHFDTLSNNKVFYSAKESANEGAYPCQACCRAVSNMY